MRKIFTSLPQASVFYFNADSCENLRKNFKDFFLGNKCDVLRRENFPNVQRQEEWFLGRLCLRQALVEYGFSEQDKIEIKTDGFRPVLFYNQKKIPLHLSLTHTFGNFAVAVSDKHPVGVDLEGAERLVSDFVAQRVFSTEDEIVLKNLSLYFSNSRLALWCLREAEVKVGLFRSIFAAKISDPWTAQLRIQEHQDAEDCFFGGRVAPWIFLIRPLENFYIAVVTQEI